MRAGDLVQETISALDANRARSLLTVLGVVIGIAAVIAMTALIGGVKAGLIRPISLWPYPYSAFDKISDKTKAVISVELSMGQMLQDINLGVKGRVPVRLIHRVGGMLPTSLEVVEKTKKILEEVR